MMVLLGDRDGGCDCRGVVVVVVMETVMKGRVMTVRTLFLVVMIKMLLPGLPVTFNFFPGT